MEVITMAINIPKNIGKGFSNLDKLEAVLNQIKNDIEAIPNLDYTAAIAAINVAILALQADSPTTFKITLNGKALTPISFIDDTPAILKSTEIGMYDLSIVGSGGTIIINADGSGVQTVTINFTAGTSVSDATPSTDISAGEDKKFMISVDGDEAEEVELDLTADSGLDSGIKIATEMQTKIQALGGNKTAVTVTYNDVVAGKYAIVSGTLGTGSSVVITPAALNNVTEELKIGVDVDGVETAGTGAVANSVEVLPAEIAAAINAGTTGLVASVDADGYIVLTSDTSGIESSILMGDSTLKTVLGLANAAVAFGAQGLGFDANFANANYFVSATLNDATSIAGKCLSITDRTVSGFNVRCETAAATDDVDLIIIR